ncbi:MAG TPA: cell filamentation protein Fic [Mogibacterium sp.]|nr:cell filamentation protein Fic [Mogibacterium sp.]
MDNIYCYPGTNVLINKLNIKDSSVLSEVEGKLSSLRIHQMEKTPITGNFDLLHLQAIHRFIFQDIYEWAGELRTLEIHKENSFCMAMQIPAYANDIFSRLKQDKYLNNLDRDNFILKLSALFSDINALQLFREGNGRTQREFIKLLVRYNGYDINFSHVSDDDMIQASISSFYKDIDLMNYLIRKCLEW